MKKTYFFLVGLFILLFLFLCTVSISNVTANSMFGTFCQECKIFQTVSGGSYYGFGFGKCNDQVGKMNNQIDFKMIENYIDFLDKNSFSSLSKITNDLMIQLLSENYESYHLLLNDYKQQIDLLTIDEQKVIESYFVKFKKNRGCMILQSLFY